MCAGNDLYVSAAIKTVFGNQNEQLLCIFTKLYFKGLNLHTSTFLVCHAGKFNHKVHLLYNTQANFLFHRTPSNKYGWHNGRNVSKAIVYNRGINFVLVATMLNTQLHIIPCIIHLPGRSPTPANSQHLT